MTSRLNESVGRTTQFLTPNQKSRPSKHLNHIDIERARIGSASKPQCVDQYESIKPFSNCPRCYYWNQVSDTKMNDKRKSTGSCRDPNLILEQRARMQKKKQQKLQREILLRNKYAQTQKTDQQILKPPSEVNSQRSKNNQRRDMINDYKRSHAPQSRSEQITPVKQPPPESYQKQRQIDLNKFNPTTSLKPPNRLVLNKYPGAIKTKYMEDYPAHFGGVPQTQKIERKSLLHKPFSHQMETKTSKNIDFQGRPATNLKKVKHEENLKIDRDIPFFGGTSYSNGFLNWGSAGSPPPTKPQIHQINLPLNAKTSYGEAFRQTENFTKSKPTIDRNAWQDLDVQILQLWYIPQIKLRGRNHQEQRLREIQQCRESDKLEAIIGIKTNLMIAEQTAQTGLKGIFDTTHKASFQTYKVGGKQKVDQKTLNAPIF